MRRASNRNTGLPVSWPGAVRRLGLLRLTAVVTGISAVAPAVCGEIGTLAGMADVTPTGAATYTVPLSVPAGANGLVPEMALSYNSQRGEGLAGYGWTLSGLPRISRCSSSPAVDGRYRALHYDAADRLCLDGRPLIRIGPDEYRTEIHDYERIRAHGLLAPASPAYFTIELRSGRTLVLGNDRGDSDAVLLASGRAEVRTWLLKRIIDPYDNEIVVAWYNDAVDGEAHPLEVAWSANPAQGRNARHTLRFTYTDRRSGCGGATCPDIRSGYMGGSRWQRAHRLRQVVHRFDGIRVTTWDLAYAATTATGRSVLETVRRCGYADGSEACLPATHFTAHGSATGWMGIGAGIFPRVSVIAWDDGQVGDVNGDGHDELIWIDPVTRHLHVFYMHGGYLGDAELVQQVPDGASFSPLDYDGDGDADILIRNGNAWSVASSTSGDVPEFTTIPLSIDSGGMPAVLDLNGDGRSDLLYRCQSDSQALCVRLNTYPAGTWSEPYASGLPQMELANNVNWFHLLLDLRNKSRLPDFDGDGRHDVLLPNGTVPGSPALATWHAYLSTGGAFEAVPMGSFTGLRVIALDVNGDGLSDVVYNVADNHYGYGTWRVRLSTGTGFSAELDTGIPAVRDVLPVVVDYDADGRDDLLLAVGDQWIAYPSRGIGYFVDDGRTTVLPPPSDAPWVLAANVRGRTESDLFIARADVNQWTFDFHLASDDSDLLSTVTNGVGNVQAFYYRQPSDVSVLGGTGASTRIRRRTNMPVMVTNLVRSDDGIGGTYQREYRYRNGQLDVTGRGFLGFSSIEIDDSRDEYLTLGYRLRFPQTGKLRLIRNYQTAARQKLRRSTVLNYGVDTKATASADPAAGIHFVYQSDATVWQYDEYGDLLTTTETVASQHDFEHGIATRSETTVSSPYHSGTHRTVVQTQPDAAAFTGTWCPGLPHSVQITATGFDGQSDVRMAEFSYNTTRCSLASVVMDPLGSRPLETVLSYDGFGNPVQRVQRASNNATEPRETRFTYDPDGYRLTQQRFLVSQSSNACGASGTSVWETRSIAWNYALGVAAARTTVDGVTTLTEYDNFGRPVAERMLGDARATMVSYVACDAGCPSNSAFQIRATSADGAESRTIFDSLGRMIASAQTSFDGRERISRLIYDESGRIARRSVPYLQGDAQYWTDFRYDAFHRIASISRPRSETDPAGLTTTISYDKLFVTTVDPAGNASSRSGLPTGELASMTDAAGNTTVYRYDGFGQIAAIQDAAGNAWSFHYDGRGLPSTVTTPDSGTWNYEFNVFGDLMAKTDGAADTPKTIRYKYDRRGRLVQRYDQSGWVVEGMTQWSYQTERPGMGRLIAVDGPAPGYGETYLYDASGAVARSTVTVDGTSYVTDYTYDQYKRMVRMTYPQTIAGHRPAYEYRYDSRGLLSAVHDVSGGLDEPLYTVAGIDDPLGRVSRVTFGRGSAAYHESRRYDHAAGFLSSIQAGFASLLLDRSYEWDISGNLLLRSAEDRPGDPVDTFSYDNLNRLTRATTQTAGNVVSDVTYSYDTLGNLISKSDFASVYRYSPAHPHAVAATSGGPAAARDFSYDRHGNTTSIGGSGVEWSAFDKPLAIEAAGGSISLIYGPDRRPVQLDGGGTRWTRVGRHFSVEERDGHKTFHANVYFGSRLVFLHIDSAQPVSSRGYYVHQDHIGSVDTLVQAYGEDSGQVLRYAFDAFGKRRNVDWSPDPAGDRLHDDHVTELGFTGHAHLDEIGMIDMGGRIQMPDIGRMLSADTYLGRVGETQSHNAYSYVQNNPLTWTDPTGHQRKPVGGHWSEYWFSDTGGDLDYHRGGPEEVPWWQNPFLLMKAQGPRFCLGCRVQRAHDPWTTDDAHSGKPKTLNRQPQPRPGKEIRDKSDGDSGASVNPAPVRSPLPATPSQGPASSPGSDTTRNFAGGVGSVGTAAGWSEIGLDENIKNFAGTAATTNRAWGSFLVKAHIWSIAKVGGPIAGVAGFSYDLHSWNQAQMSTAEFATNSLFAAIGLGGGVPGAAVSTLYFIGKPLNQYYVEKIYPRTGYPIVPVGP